MTTPVADAAGDTEWNNFKKLLVWREFQVRAQADAKHEGQFVKGSSAFATFDGLTAFQLFSGFPNFWKLGTPRFRLIGTHLQFALVHARSTEKIWCKTFAGVQASTSSR